MAEPTVNFLENIFAQLRGAGNRTVLQEMRANTPAGVSAATLLEEVRRARAYIRAAGMQPGERCGLLGPNSIRWVALDLALLAERIIVVPLYARQAPAELAANLKDCQARLLFCSDAALAESLVAAWPDAPPRVSLEEALHPRQDAAGVGDTPNARRDDEMVTIIYTSGTSGEAKGVCLTAGNVTHMTGCTTERLDQLMGGSGGAERIFHYLPFNFAGSWILLLTSLARNSTLTLSTDLTRLVEEIQTAAPNYFLNVPTLLERVRRGVEEALAKRGAPVRMVFRKARAAWERRHLGRGRALDGMWLALGRRLVFSKIRARFGPHLRALICGSAPLAPDTQLFFMMLGIPVLQVYGLTETTAICTMDDPRQPVEPGCVGPAIPGVEMKTGDNQEILVRGPNVFPGYWNRPEETAKALVDGWFHSGDQGEVNVSGNWRISGRIKNLIILNSGHNIAPEPVEEKIQALLPGAQHVLLVGNGRGYLCMLLTGSVEAPAAQAALEAVNPDLPHYRQVRNFCVLGEAFTAENGMLTANGKLRRDAIARRFANEIEEMYQRKSE